MADAVRNSAVDIPGGAIRSRNGEVLVRTEGRAFDKAAFEKIIDENAGKTVVAFCHAMVTMCFLQKMLGYDDKYGIRVDYASITRVQASRNGARSIRSANETMHLGDHFILSP